MSNTDEIIIEEQIVTRIQIRHDTLQAWEFAQTELVNKGKLESGEFGLIIESNTDNSYYKLIGHLGIFSTPTKINNCPVVFMAELFQDEFDPNIYTSTEPVVYVPPEEIPEKSVVSWNSTTQRWEVVNSVVTLNEFPTQDGSLIYDSATNSFSIGEVVFADEIDCGDYGGTDV